ncbi:hypothetical protein [Ruania albidiflava]|uniref:hypothetical protein n=1 Tax=Ruania albidiflava TaxID=366586 RepID=UPI0003B2EA2D|nr:hypothetical protein [Ruania albidiflava]
MAGEDIYIKLSELETVKTQLDAIIEEFGNATENSENLEAAIGTPYGRGELQSKARDFEERWDDKRTQLKDGLEGVRDHVGGVIDEIQKWDTETAIQLEPEK